MSNQIPKGVIAVYVHECDVLAQVADFHRSAPGGYTLREAQESRARMALGRAVVASLASPLLSDNLDAYECERIMNKLPGRVHVMPIGWTEEEVRNG